MNDAYITLIVMAVVMILFIAKSSSIIVISMSIPIVLALTGVILPSDAFLGFADTNVILFGSMFIIGGAMFKAGAAERAGKFVISLTKGSERKLLFGIWLIVSITSAFLSNTGCAAVLLPICLGIAESTGWNKKHILMTLAYTASTGGMMTLIGTPPNITANAILEQHGMEGFGFFEFALLGLPVNLLCGIWLFLSFKPTEMHKEGEFAGSNIQWEKKPFKKEEIIAIAIMLTVIFIMATGLLPLYIASSIGALICILSGILTEKEAVESVDWTTIFLFAGTLVLAEAMDKSGAGKLIADTVVQLIGEQSSSILILSVIFCIAAILTQIMSNTAICALMAPIGIQLAEVLQANPKAILMTIAVASSAAFATPMATPPNTLVMGPGNLRTYDFLKQGLPMIGISCLLCILIIPVFWPLYE